MNTHDSPHEGAEVQERGRPLRQADKAIILMHGRGGSAEDILALGEEIGLNDVSLLAPQAKNHTWYPNSFMAPLPSNEPWLSSALALIDSIVLRCESIGIPAPKLAIVGFSQGACLATEYVARTPRPYGALIAFTGGLIGPPGIELHHKGELTGTRVLLSSGDPDPHVPWSRVEESAKQLSDMGASVELVRRPGRSHTVLRDEVASARRILQAAWDSV